MIAATTTLRRFMLPCMLLCAWWPMAVSLATAADKDVARHRAVERGLDWLAKKQSRMGHWAARDGRYPTAMTALAGTALLCEGSTTTQGKYAPQIRRAVDYLTSRSCTNGLIGDPLRDDRYTYGHGFSMLFLSEVLGEEEDADRRKTLVDVLSRAVTFTGEAQTTAGGWGYVSAKDGNDFDEGSTTITQVQGLRGCRNAGIAVPSEIINKAIKYIRDCTGPDGGVYYSSKHRSGGRPAITAAAVACLFNAGDYDSKYVPKLLEYCRKNLSATTGRNFGHWHYTHFYYSQVLYREGGKEWKDYRDRLYAEILSPSAVNTDGSWSETSVGEVYGTAINLIMLQLDDAALPIYQR